MKKPRVLLTNDDGIYATGINKLFESLSKNMDVTMLAPDRERSSCGHAITLTMPIRIQRIKKNAYACTGFPADCVLVGIGSLKKGEIDVVVSGPNHGANLGQDRFYSGTMAAAREACFRDIPSISLSVVNYNSEEAYNFSSCEFFMEKFLGDKLYEFIPKGTLLNVNFPNIPLDQVKGIKICCPGEQVYTGEVVTRQDARGRDYFWVGGRYQGHKGVDGSDAVAVAQGYISCDIQQILNKELGLEKLKSRLLCLLD